MISSVLFWLNPSKWNLSNKHNNLTRLQVTCLLLQGMLEMFSGLGMMAGPPLGGFLYQVKAHLH